MNILEIKSLNKQYGQLKALDNVDLDVTRGSVFGLLGPNGAGKTTLLRIINSILVKDSGSVKINGEDVDTNIEIKSNLEIQIERVENEYVLVFMNGNEEISREIIKFNSIITYPTMDSYTENGIEYIFIWDDNSYNGQPMPSMNLTITGKYQEKAEAPIYFGSFKVARADYDSGNTSQYFNSEDIENPQIFGSILTADCTTKGTFILKIPVDNDYSLAKRKLYWRPYVYLVPKNVANIFTLYDGIDNDITSTLVTDNKTLIYKGHEYIMFVYQTQATLIGNTVQELPQSIILK
jgi:ABC-type oligopeptide transport system ATPase subunit